MKILFTVTLCLITTLSGFTQYTASWGNNTGGIITREQLFNDSLVLNTVNGQVQNYEIISFVLFYQYSGGSTEFTIQSNKFDSYMKERIRGFQIGQRFSIERITAKIDNRSVRAPDLIMKLVGPEACLRKGYSLLLTRRNGKMSKEQFLDNNILDVYIPGDYNSSGTGPSSRIDTSFTVQSYHFSYHLKDERLSRHIKVKSNIITEEIKNIVRELPNYKFRYDHLSLAFYGIIAIDNSGETVSVRNLTVSIPKAYFFPDSNNVHPNAKELMTEAFLFSKKDKTGPFGSHYASKTYFIFYDWRAENQTTCPKDFLLKHIKSKSYPLFDFSKTNYKYLKAYIDKTGMHFSFLTGIDREILTFAFGQLYLEGKIDRDILKMAEDALARQLNPKIISMWPDDYEEEREHKLKIISAIIRQLK